MEEKSRAVSAGGILRTKGMLMEQEQAEAYLAREPLLHMDMLECLRHGEATLLRAEEHGVLLLNRACGAVMISAGDGETADRLLEESRGDGLFVAHHGLCIGKTEKRFRFTGKRLCRQAIYLRSRLLPEAVCPVRIRPLDAGSLPFVMEHYSHADDEDYLRERLSAGAMFGAYLEGNPAGFIGIHSEGSLGMLEVLPEYRRRGVAAALGTFLVNRRLKEGRVPFSQIILGNGPSYALHEKLGFSISRDNVCWLFTD